MNHSSATPLTPQQLSTLRSSLHQGSCEASAALARWIGKPSVVEVDALRQLPLQEATGVLAAGEDPICFCSVEMRGILTGEMILAFDDACGLALADLLLGQPLGAASEWSELAISAALETTNILCCAYMNSLARVFQTTEGESELLPSPPRFSRDFAESLLQFALMGQAMESDQVILAETRFEIDATPVNWTLLFIPDAASMQRLPTFLQSGPDEAGGPATCG